MNIFLDTISPTNKLIAFENDNIIYEYDFAVKLNESTKLIQEFETFLNLANITYSQIENIIVVNWPGSFTWIRTTILFVNSINFINKKHLTWINYFQLFKNYPIIKTSSKKDCFVKWWENQEIQVLQNDEIDKILEEKNIELYYWDYKNWINNINYLDIIKNTPLQKNTILSPFYLKKPSIW